ncbi:MAG TPA: alpha/beta hydrolase [Candidatus Hydrogenedentes bacterium]|nr:alpha/beta hydrolase [Candidatus Hydrogenedentota bacterium]HPJ99287.1 alpha/beta hydrolase [Candidatus Hydrogenedentota bacterium]
MPLTYKTETGYTYFEEGSGSVIILLHGLMGGPENFQSVLTDLRKDYRAVAPVLPLFDLPLRKTGVEELSQFLHEFITHKRFHKVALLGNSLGGHVALRYALTHPENVSGMILTGSSGLKENTMGTTLPRRKDYDYVREKAALTFYDPDMATKELVDEVFEVLNSNVKALKLLRMAKSAVRENLADELRHLTMPVGLIWGRDDVVTPPEVAHEFHDKLALSRLSFIDKCGHAPMMERPDEFNVILRWYLYWIDQVSRGLRSTASGHPLEASAAPGSKEISAVAWA